MSWAAEVGWVIIGVAFVSGGPNEPMARGPYPTKTECKQDMNAYLKDRYAIKGQGAFLLCQYRPAPHPSWSRKTPLKKLS